MICCQAFEAYIILQKSVWDNDWGVHIFVVPTPQCLHPSLCSLCLLCQGSWGALGLNNIDAKHYTFFTRYTLCGDCRKITKQKYTNL